MIVGWQAADPTYPAAEAQNYLGVRKFALQGVYLRYNIGWPAGMLATSWITEAAGADNVMVSIPMLIGDQSGSPVAGSGSGQTTSPQNPAGATVNTTMTLTDVAAGLWDSLFNQAIANIASLRPNAIIRIGWEQYGNGWYPWNGAALYSQYTAAYRHLVGLCRAQSAGFTFDWNGNVAYAAYDPTLAYPGDAWVDYMTTDLYDSFNPGGAAGFTAYRDAVLANALAFAVTRGKPFGLSEFGTFVVGFGNGYGDDPAWLRAVHDWCRQNQAKIAYVLWFNHDGGVPSGDGGGSLQRNPQLAAQFRTTFGMWAQQLSGQTTHRFISSGTSRLRVNR